MTSHETWDYIIESYNGYGSEETKTIYKSFCDLVVKQIASSNYSNYLFASQSHSYLIISKNQAWPERIQEAFICVDPQGKGRQGSIELLEPQKGGGPRICYFKIECLNEEMWNHLEPLLKQLVEIKNSPVEKK